MPQPTPVYRDSRYDDRYYDNRYDDYYYEPRSYDTQGRRSRRRDLWPDDLDPRRSRDQQVALVKPTRAGSQPERGGNYYGGHRSHRRHRSEDRVDPRDSYYAHERPHHSSSSRRDRHHDDRKRPRDHRDHHDIRPRSLSTHGPALREASKAAVTAGLIEGFRARHNPDRSSRAITAAASAAAIDMFIGRDGRAGDTERDKTRHVVESAVGGLAFDRIANGSSKRTR